MVTIERVICPVDLSVHSANALRVAAAWARWYGAWLHVLHVAPLPQSVFGSMRDISIWRAFRGSGCCSRCARYRTASPAGTRHCTCASTTWCLRAPRPASRYSPTILPTK